jgi:hypothetical protein
LQIIFYKIVPYKTPSLLYHMLALLALRLINNIIALPRFLYFYININFNFNIYIFSLQNATCYYLLRFTFKALLLITTFKIITIIAKPFSLFIRVAQELLNINILSKLFNFMPLSSLKTRLIILQMLLLLLKKPNLLYYYIYNK